MERRGGRPTSRSADTANDIASNAKAPRTPIAATRVPPRSVPRATCRFSEVPIQALAWRRSSRFTSAGTALLPAGAKSVSRTAEAATSASSTAKDGRDHAMVAKIAALPTSHRTMSVRCSTRSARTPASGPRKRGRELASKSTPTAVPVPSVSCTRSTSATRAMPSPTCEIVRASHSRRNDREVLSGLGRPRSLTGHSSPARPGVVRPSAGS